MKFIYSCDIHGNDKKYQKLLDLCLENNINNIVIGGDLLPKRCDRETEQPIYVKNKLDKYFSLLNVNNINFIFIPGNDDVELVDEYFGEVGNKYSNVFNINKKILEIENVNFVGLSNILDNPFKRKDRVVIEKGLRKEKQRENEIWIEKSSKKITPEEWFIYRESLPYMENVLEDLPQPKNNNKLVYVFHCPPYGIGLDNCVGDFLAGSKAISDFILHSKAYMTFHGHIHESYELSGKWFNNLGDTISIQPGQYDLEIDKLVYVIIDTDKNIYERYEVDC